MPCLRAVQLLADASTNLAANEWLFPESHEPQSMAGVGRKRKIETETATDAVAVFS